MINLIIADDHQMFLDGLTMLLSTNAEFHIVGEARNGQEVLDLLHDNPNVDVVLMDVNMPIMDGIQATKQIKEHYPYAKVLMLTMFGSRDYIEKLLKAGALGYVLKNTGKEELFAAIESVSKGQSFFSKEVTERIMEGLQGRKVLEHDPMLVELTEREKEVLKLIVEERTTQEIAESLFISHHTVETHRKNLISKLQVRNIAGLVKYALQHGLVG